MKKSKPQMATGQFTHSQSVGQETLDRMASVDRYNSWIYEIIRPYIGKRVLEVGCGIGNMTAYFLESELMVSIDILPESSEILKEKYARHSRFLPIQGDICDDSLVAELKNYCFDTIICLNVLEHIEDDAHALRNMRYLLNGGGKLLLFVPAGSSLYGTLDFSLKHYRRYNRHSLQQLISEQGYSVEKLSYVNMAGVAGWYLNSKILKRHVLPKGMLGLFNILTPLLMKLESRIEVPFGLSIISILSHFLVDKSP